MKVFEEFDVEPEVPKQPTKLDTVAQLIERALKNQHCNWEFIKSFEEFLMTLELVCAHKKIVKGFVKSTKSLYKVCRKSIKNDKSDLDVVISLTELEQTVMFYKAEIRTLEDMLQEFRAYTNKGHLAEMILGYKREEMDLYDHRRSKHKNI